MDIQLTRQKSKDIIRISHLSETSLLIQFRLHSIIFEGNQKNHKKKSPPTYTDGTGTQVAVSPLTVQRIHVYNKTIEES